MTDLTKLRSKLKTIDWFNQKMYFGLIIASVVLSLFLAHSNTLPEAKTPVANDSIDTYIPSGYSLVTVAVQNFEYVDSVLGQYGVADLFKGDRIVAGNLKIVRSASKPNYFGVLVPETKAPPLVTDGSSYTVALKNPKNVGTEFVISPGKRRARRTIVIEKSVKRPAEKTNGE